MSSELTPEHQQRPNLEAHAIRALHAILAGSVPNETDTTPLTGDVKACIEALVDALRDDGAPAARKVFLALSRDNRPWLMQLASSAPPDLAGLISEATASEKPARRMRLIPAEEMLTRPAQPWLISQILPRDSIALMYGESGSLKSFLAIAWSLAIGTGRHWLGRNVAQGPVVYIAAEGGYGVMKRLNAWIAFHHWQIPNERRLGVAFYDAPLALQEPACLIELLKVIREDDYLEGPPVLVVLDTLSRCAAGIDEDSNTEMARVLAQADSIREELHCTVLIVHHTGKDRDRGPRGASALLCNVEAGIAISPARVNGLPGNRVECSKAKDARPFSSIYLQAEAVTYGSDPEEDCSLVLIQGESDEEGKEKPEEIMYALLNGKERGFTEWVNAALEHPEEEKRLTKKVAEHAIDTLKHARRVQQSRPRGPYSVVPLVQKPSGQ